MADERFEENHRRTVNELEQAMQHAAKIARIRRVYCMIGLFGMSPNDPTDWAEDLT
jgi:hypothetical protein